MFRNAFWWVTIVAASAAIVAGYLHGAAGVHAPPVRVPHAARARASRPLPMRPVTRARAVEAGAPSQDAFADDDVVVDRLRPSLSRWQPERLIVFVVDCGWSRAVETTFLQANLPLAFVIDPDAPQAGAVAALARAQSRAVYAQVRNAPSAASLARLRATLGAFAGIASRSDVGMAAALRGTGLAFFDERGDAGAAAFARAGVPLYSRDVTADDRSDVAYTAFMLRQAERISRLAGRAVVLVRPLPTTLEALRAIRGDSLVRIVAAY